MALARGTRRADHPVQACIMHAASSVRCRACGPQVGSSVNLYWQPGSGVATATSTALDEVLITLGLFCLGAGGPGVFVGQWHAARAPTTCMHLAFRALRRIVRNGLDAQRSYSPHFDKPTVQQQHLYKPA
eukprot:5507727-Pleurochrysis_carterae.AAC.2